MIDNEQLDDADFYELVIKYLIRDPAVLKAAITMGFKSDDMLTSTQTGIQIYKQFAQIALEVGQAPIDKAILKSSLNAKAKKGLLAGYELEDIKRLITFIYDGELNTTWMLEALPKFIGRRRMVKAQLDNVDDADKAYKAMHKAAWEITTISLGTKSKSLNPFKEVVYKEDFHGIGTGYGQIDKVIMGIAYGEYGIIVGHSGSGKTAWASTLTLNAVAKGKKVLYISLEEPAENVSDRFYARQFLLNYSLLHQGKLRMDVQIGIDEMEPVVRKQFENNLKVEDMRDLAPLNKDQIIVKLEQLAEEGFIPDLVIIDQLDYITPVDSENKQRWEKYELASFEMDILSHYRIKKEHRFALYVLHQASGPMKLIYTNADIASCKGVIKPADLVMCIGRESPNSEAVRLFTLKSRHSQNISHNMIFHGAFMQFIWANEAEEAVKEKASNEIKRRRAIGNGSDGNSDITQDTLDKPGANPNKP